MKKILPILFTLGVIANSLSGQTIKHKGVDAFNSNGYLYVVYLSNGNIIHTENLVLNDKDSEFMKMLSRLETIQRFGIITKTGAILLKMKSNVKLVTITEILNSFSIIGSDKNLPVYIDDKYVDRPESILAESSEITAVDIIRDPADLDKRAIDIITKGYNISKQIKTPKNTRYDDYYLNGNEVMALDSFLNIRK